MTLPAWLYVTVQVPAPLVIVIVAEPLPLPEHDPEPAIVTGFPEAPPVAATLKVVLYTAEAGAFCVTLMVWPACWAAVVSVT